MLMLLREKCTSVTVVDLYLSLSQGNTNRSFRANNACTAQATFATDSNSL